MPSLNNKLFQTILQKINKTPESYNTFKETGTFMGDTTNFIYSNFNMEVYTIELSEHYHSMAKRNFANIDKIHPILGDSSVEVKKLLHTLNQNNLCIFWLDGHYSSGDTAQGEKDCPLIEECTSIDSFYKGEHALVLIDDYRLFGMNANEDWSQITDKAILDCFKEHTIVNNFIEDDTMVVEIKKK